MYFSLYICLFVCVHCVSFSLRITTTNTAFNNLIDAPIVQILAPGFPPYENWTFLTNSFLRDQPAADQPFNETKLIIFGKILARELGYDYCRVNGTGCDDQSLLSAESLGLLSFSNCDENSVIQNCTTVATDFIAGFFYTAVLSVDCYNDSEFQERVLKPCIEGPNNDCSGYLYRLLYHKVPPFYEKILRGPKLPKYSNPTLPMYLRQSVNSQTVEYQHPIIGWIGLHDDTIQFVNESCDPIKQQNVGEVICRNMGYPYGYTKCSAKRISRCVHLRNAFQGCPNVTVSDIFGCDVRLSIALPFESAQISCGYNFACVQNFNCNFPMVCNSGGVCECALGFSSNGTECADIDECETYKNSACDPTEFCVNVVGSYFCRIGIPGIDNTSNFTISSNFLNSDLIVLTQVFLNSNGTTLIRNSGSLNISESGNLNLDFGLSLFVGNGSTIDGTLTISGNSVLNVSNCLNISNGILQFSKPEVAATSVILSDCPIGTFKHISSDPCVTVSYKPKSVEIFFAGKDCASKNLWMDWYTAVIVVGCVVILGVIFSVIILKTKALKRQIFPFTERRKKIDS